MSVAMILAAGKAERHNGGNKPLLKVGNETLLERMVRQAKPHVGAIYLVTHREDLSHPDCRLLNPPSRNYICDTIYSGSPMWCLGSKTILLLGDVYYTEWAMSFILHYEQDIAAFGEDCNIHALTIPYRQAFWAMGRLTEFRLRVDCDPAKYRYGKLYAFCDFAHIKRVPLDEHTTDIDSPQEHKRLLEKLKL